MNERSRERILVVAAHPDDEVLGCGATVKKWTSQGAEAVALIMSQGVTSRYRGGQKQDESQTEQKLNALRNDCLRAA
ncbi:MAG: PIG-L family deacetylase, partial [Oscillospiraceae bacterium]|nr:PIG-L family deacetylase [Oscillospiraceae bacterium]